MQSQDVVKLLTSLETCESYAIKANHKKVAKYCQKMKTAHSLAMFADNYQNPRRKYFDFLLPEITFIIANYDHLPLKINNLQIKQKTKEVDHFFYASQHKGSKRQQKKMMLSFTCNNLFVTAQQKMWYYAHVDTPNNFEYFSGFYYQDKQRLNINIEHPDGNISNDLKADILKFIHNACVQFCSCDPFNVPYIFYWELNPTLRTTYEGLLPGFVIENQKS